jgi:hypothetical protein
VFLRRDQSLTNSLHKGCIHVSMHRARIPLQFQGVADIAITSTGNQLCAAVCVRLRSFQKLEEFDSIRIIPASGSSVQHPAGSRMKMRESWRAARKRLLTQETVAYHEAGHVLVAYEFGWWVRRGGVRLGAWAHACLHHDAYGANVRARVCIATAGILAEQKFHGVQWDLEEDFLEHIRAVRAGREGVRLNPLDFRAIALALLDDDPPISLTEARAALSYCRDYTNALLDDARVWAGVERLAKKLARRRYLSPRAVRQVLGDAFFESCGASIAG